VNNVYRHSGGHSCSLKLQYDPDQLRIEIRDRGHGTPQNQPRIVAPRASVFAGIEERLGQLGGTLEIESSEIGATDTATLPLSPLQGQPAQS